MITKSWINGIKRLSQYIKKNISERNADTFLTDEDLALKKYFDNLHRSSIILEMIKSKFHQQFKNNQITKLSEEIKDLPTKEEICEEYRKKIYEYLESLKKFSFINNVRHTQTVSIMTK